MKQQLKVGDRVKLSCKYFNGFEDMIGTIVNIEHKDFDIEVKFDDEFDVDGIKVFTKKELKQI